MASQDTKDYIVNPITGRLIKRGSKTYKRIISASLIKEELVKSPKDNIIFEADDISEAKQMTSRMSKKSFGKNKILTRRGNKVLRANRRPTQEETIDRVSSIAVDTVRENKNKLLKNNLNDDQMDEYIRRMIQIKLIGGKTPLPYDNDELNDNDSDNDSDNDDDLY